MNKFLKDIAARYNIEIEAAIDFMSHFMIADIDKSELIVNKDGFNDEFYILKEGIIRAFIPTESEDRTIWFGYPGQAFLMYGVIIGTNRHQSPSKRSRRASSIIFPK